ncbi:MAG: methyltransferase domain-containing protein [Pseudomonadota bacterium]
MEFAELEKAGWSDAAIASSYATAFAFAAEQCVPALLRASACQPGGAFLDLCCGHGIVSGAAISLGASVTGVDFSPAMIAMAEEAEPTATFIEGDVSTLQFDDNSFDAVAMGFGILHVPDAPVAVAEAARVLKPGGRFAYSCWHGGERTSALPAVFSAVEACGDPSVSLPASRPAPFYAQPDNANALMAQAGLDDVRIESVDSYWLCDSADDPIRYFAEGTVRGAGLLRAQPKAHLDQIRERVVAWVSANSELDPATSKLRVPLPAAIVSGKKG